MVKGVTKRVVEIKETGSGYFERAIFFINAECSRGTSEYTLSEEARRIINNLSNENGERQSRKKQSSKERALSLLKLAISAAAGVFATLLFTRGI